MQITAREIATFLGGTIEGNPDIVLDKPSKIEEGVPGSITFLSNPKYEPFIYKTNASAVLVDSNFQPSSSISATLIRVPDVYGAITQLLEAFTDISDDQRKIEPTAVVSEGATLGSNVGIGESTVICEGANIGDDCLISSHVYIGPNVKIGQNTVLQPGVKIMKDCEVGDNCTIHSNTVIGADGFGFKPDSNGCYKKIPQIGNVVIENDVEIGANCVIDRATMGSTVIEEGVKLDNLIQIAHNVVVGAHTVIAAQAGIAGSTKIGKYCMIGGQVGIAGHLKIPDRTNIAAQSGLNTGPKKEGTALFGSPAIAYKDYLKSYVGFKKLPELMKKLEELESEVKILRSEK
ncbi:MAG: UDP-3-O-(3-hydroxymyristoyl)glucosamine N-acyltransferase [Saprospirales bacterium]|nr:MAG: UDP-3-O-(3-hydroxymyristoyl)glucosamine N-acyltransferase [Saprospirales bacterium]